MLQNISFLIPIVIFSVLNVLLIAIPSLLLWLRDIFDIHSIVFIRLNKVKIKIFGAITALLFCIFEVALLIFVFLTNNLQNMLWCIVAQLSLFIVLCFVPRLLYYFGDFSIEVVKLLHKVITIILEIVLTAIFIVFFVPIVIFKIIVFCIKNATNKPKN